MESEQQDIPNSNLRHDSSPPGLRRMSSLFKRIMRKEDASANSSSRNIIVPQLKRSLHREAENTDSTTAGNRLLSWIRSSSDISRSREVLLRLDDPDQLDVSEALQRPVLDRQAPTQRHFLCPCEDAYRQ
ncbi:hypothetical protein UCREL1_300 [Eutypa lata UCREL1]|uniref:Uncharacterized protein n=1 Tax=Eutypa lata (strain UCR-EL1) TaxID=1287681 RepID=M7T6Z9_EUTLA|nr:hypothetical protein UCREL1_300 [Eutypa lata UCREL1]